MLKKGRKLVANISKLYLCNVVFYQLLKNMPSDTKLAVLAAILSYIYYYMLFWLRNIHVHSLHHLFGSSFHDIYSYFYITYYNNFDTAYMYNHVHILLHLNKRLFL